MYCVEFCDPLRRKLPGGVKIVRTVRRATDYSDGTDREGTEQKAENISTVTQIKIYLCFASLPSVEWDPNVE